MKAARLIRDTGIILVYAFTEIHPLCFFQAIAADSGCYDQGQ